MMSWEDRYAEMAEPNQAILDLVQDKQRGARFVKGLVSGLLILGGIALVSYLFFVRV